MEYQIPDEDSINHFETRKQTKNLSSDIENLNNKLPLSSINSEKEKNDGFSINWYAGASEFPPKHTNSFPIKPNTKMKLSHISESEISEYGDEKPERFKRRPSLGNLSKSSESLSRYNSDDDSLSIDDLENHPENYKTKYGHKSVLDFLVKNRYKDYITNKRLLFCIENNKRLFKNSNDSDSDQELEKDISIEKKGNIHVENNDEPHSSFLNPAHKMSYDPNEKHEITQKKSFPKNSNSVEDLYKLRRSFTDSSTNQMNKKQAVFSNYYCVCVFISMILKELQDFKKLLFIGNPYVNYFRDRKLPEFSQLLNNELFIADLITVLTENSETKL